MGGVEAEVVSGQAQRLSQGLAAVERAMNPALLVEVLRGVDFDGHAMAFGQAQELGKLAWVGMAVAAGSAAEHCQRGDGLVRELADRFGLHVSRVQRLIRIYQQLLKPMIDTYGEGITLRLTEQTWYEYSVEYAPIAGKPPAELLALAEDRKEADRTYSTKDFKSDISAGDTDDGSTVSQGMKLLRMCRRMSEIDDASLDDAIQGADLRKHAGHVSDAYSMLERLNAGLMARGMEAT